MSARAPKSIESRDWLGAGLLIAGLWLLSSASALASDFSFRADILPILSKAGCNSGACHGAATGQGGFRLSLLGYDPEEDYWNITREFSGRRVSLEAPFESLFLRKPTQQIEHEGGRRVPRDSESYGKLVDWIKAGAPFGSRALKVARLEADPPERFFDGTNEPFQLKVTAVLNDGMRRDVTGLALYTSNDEGIVEVDKNGAGRTRNRGVTSIMIRYSGEVAAVRVAIPFRAPVFSPSLAAGNFIDREIAAELNRLGILASELSEDAEFFRRVHLDLTGRLPDLKKVREFLRGEEKDRAKTIDQLLASEEFTDFWTLKFADLLLINGKRGSEKAAAVYHDWLREQVSKNSAWNEVVSKLLTAEGDTSREGPPNFYSLASDPRDIAEYAGSIFLGTQIGCARYHAHPTDRWTQDDYYDFSACFAGVSRDGSFVRAAPGRELEYPKSKQPATPKALGDSAPLPALADPRAGMARVLTNDPLFARAIVNRVWKHLLGRGLVEPVDDLRPTNPATHPALLEKLAGEFRSHNFDLRWLIRTIAASRTYQLSSRVHPHNRQDDRFYSHAFLKPLSAQVLVDAIAQVTGRPEQFAGQPEGIRAVQLVGAQTESYALDVLGRCPREKTCETGAGRGGGLAQALHLINGSTINQKLASGVTAELSSTADPEVVEELYLRALSRRPAPEESDFWKATLQRAPNRTEVIEDFLWTLLNSREFAFNH